MMTRNCVPLVLLGVNSYIDKLASNINATGQKCQHKLGNYFRLVALAQIQSTYSTDVLIHIPTISIHIIYTSAQLYDTWLQTRIYSVDRNARSERTLSFGKVFSNADFAAVY